LILLALPACKSGSANSAQVVGDSPRAVVTAYLTAAKAANQAGMLALMTDEQQERARTWDKSFTKAIVDKRARLTSYEILDVAEEGDKAKASVRAEFVQGEGDPEGDRMSFELTKTGDVWRISKLH